MGQGVFAGVDVAFLDRVALCTLHFANDATP
jgi:hypothetical protein